jgi:hypothetical protein
VIDAKLSGGAIDAAVVASYVRGKSESALKRFGAFVRRRMQTSIRYRNKKSRPGQPPSARRGNRFTRLKTNKKTGASTRQAVSPLRELIAFAVSGDGMTVIVGPMIFRASAVGGGTVPPLLEEGGSGTFLDEGVRKTGRWQPRPFAGPAFRAELPRAPKLFGRT